MTPTPDVSSTDWGVWGKGLSASNPPDFPASFPGYVLDITGRGTQWLRSSEWHAIETTTVGDPGAGRSLPLSHTSNGCDKHLRLLRWQVEGGPVEVALVRHSGSTANYRLVAPVEGETPMQGIAGFMTLDGCTSPGIRAIGTSTQLLKYQWQTLIPSSEATGSAVVTGEGMGIIPRFGLTAITDFDPQEALAVVTAEYGGDVPPLACYLVTVTNNSPDYAYFTNSERASEIPGCRPSDGTEYLMHREGDTWVQISDLSGVDPRFDCEFGAALAFIPDGGVRKDLCG